MKDSQQSQWELLKIILKRQDKQKKAMREYLISNVNSVPVSQEVLNKLVWVMADDLDEIMSFHPGCDLNFKIESQVNVLDNYRKCYADLISKLDDFDIASRDSDLFQRPRKIELESHELACRKEVFSLSSAVFALVDLVRRVTKNMDIPEFDNMRKKCFDTQQHDFIIQLRRNLSHISFLESEWTIRYFGQKQTSHFEFRIAKLLKNGDFNSDARSYIQTHKVSIDVRGLFSSYNKCVEKFYSWLVPVIETDLSLEVIDYRKCIRMQRANSARCWYRVMFKQMIKPETDLFSYLQKYLTELEMKEVKKLPHCSKEQIDFIIETVDEFGACDEELREMVYEAFKIK